MKPLMPLLLAAALAATAAHAYNERGLKTYKKLCKSCHGSPFRGAAMLTKKEWENVFDEADDKMEAIHKNSAEALEQIDRSYYHSRKKYLADFLINNAKDSGVVPGCDSNYCGN